MTPTRLCATVTAPTMTALRQARDVAARLADLVELRLDSVTDPDPAGALADRRGPVIVTCRPRWEGGGFDGAEEDRRRILAHALELGADYVDVEWHAGFGDLVASGAGRVILSLHDLTGIPRDLAEQHRAMRATPAGLVKLAVTVSSLCDLLPMMRLGRCAPGRSIVIGLGPAGVPSRVLASRFGSPWTYAGDGVAPGQIPLERMVREFRVARVTSATDVYGVVGSPIAHSVSPAMHNAAFAATDLDAVYVPLQASSAADFFEFAHAIGLRGASVTAPFKEDVFAAVPSRDQSSALTLAMNTVRCDDGRWSGMNTDLSGFLEPLDRRGIRPARAAVIGAGGAARAVTVALASRGSRVTIHARDAVRAKRVADMTGSEARSEPPQPGDWDLLVNATPVGTWPSIDTSPLASPRFTPRGVVYDLVYNPARTQLLQDAQRAGCVTIGGLEMLVAQAARQFEWWTGRPANRELLREVANRALALPNW